MVRLALLLTLVLAAPATAQAARQWGDLEPFGPPAATPSVADVAADGTTVAAWMDAEGHGYARIGNGPVSPLGEVMYRTLIVAAAPDGAVAVAWARLEGQVNGVTRLFAASAGPGEALSDPVDLGAGYPEALDVTAGGDAALLFRVGDGTAIARGQDFATRVTLPGTTPRALVLTPAGEVLEVTSGPGIEPRIYAQAGAAAPTLEHELGPTGSELALTADAEGRVLAVTDTDGPTVALTVRATDGTWRAHTVPAPRGSFYVDAETNAAGDAVVTWQDRALSTVPHPVAVRAVSGSLATGDWGEPQVLDGPWGLPPTVGVGADGTAVVASFDRIHLGVRVARRDGAHGAFGPVQVAGCGQNQWDDVEVAGVAPDGTAVLRLRGGLLRDAPADTAPPDPACRVDTGETARPTYSTWPVLAGVPVDIGVEGVRRPYFKLGGTYFDGFVFDFGSGPSWTRESRTTHAFPTPGLHTWKVSSYQGGPADVEFTDTFTVDVHAAPTLRVVQRRRVLRIRANAFTGSQPRRVRFVLRHRGRVLKRRWATLGAAPERVRIPVRRRVSRVVMRQEGHVIGRVKPRQ